MKTAIILIILAPIVFFSLRKVVRVFTKQESGCSCDHSTCPSAKGSCCQSKK
ncbi:MAG: FeoB-associated Cys-rich membrane protein [Fusobacteriaceae bacterium]|jgi:hypothetical protein|nr:FeoB-associated Cys-rich membrane protein [Fusobacteriaceae bacterium]